jgi:hypothetical protein
MTIPVFPTLPGLGWSVKRKPLLSTRVAKHQSGREVRSRNWAQALYQFELTFNALDSSDGHEGLSAYSMQALEGLYLAAGGQFGTFLYTDPNDNLCGNAAFATGDGTTTGFTLLRTLAGFAGFSEPAPYVTSLAGVTSSLSGVTSIVAPAGYTLTTPNTLTFTTAPANGAALAASFTFAFLCRFLADEQEFEEFMANLHSASLEFRSVK